MKLYRQMLCSKDDVFQREPELIMESDNRDSLKRKAEALAAREHSLLEFAWVFEGTDQGYTELTVEDQCRFVVRP